MLSPKPWKLETLARLLVSLLICICAGSLVASLLHYRGTGARLTWKLGLVAAAAFACFGATLVLLRTSWSSQTLRRRLFLLPACFYAGFALAAWTQNLTGPAPSGGSVGQMIVAAVSFQGAVLVLVMLMTREHQTTWREAFGFAHNWHLALVLGLLVACIFLPIGGQLQYFSFSAMEQLPAWCGSISHWLGGHLPHWLQWLAVAADHLTNSLQRLLEPEEQMPVQTLRMASTWIEYSVLGIVTIVLAPVAEELLFRGVLYPWLKQAGFPRIALWGTSFAFAAIHLNIMTFLPLLVLALLLTGLYEWTGNLLAPIAAHGLFNALNFARLGLSDDRIWWIMLAGLTLILLGILWLLERGSKNHLEPRIDTNELE